MLMRIAKLASLALLASILPVAAQPFMVRPALEFDVLAVEIKSVKQEGGNSSPATIQYTVLSTLREHPIPQERAAKSGTAIYAPIMNGECGTGHRYPTPPPAGSKVYVLAAKPLATGYDAAFSAEPANNLPFLQRKYGELPLYPRDEAMVKDFIKAMEAERSKWEKQELQEKQQKSK